MRYPCPICGDPNAFLLWVAKEPPLGCPDDISWHKGGAIKIRNVTECRYQMGKARQRAEWRRLLPDAFDDSGNLKQGRLADVLRAFANEHPSEAVIL